MYENFDSRHLSNLCELCKVNETATKEPFADTLIENIETNTSHLRKI